MIDIHNHVLFGVDDGCDTLEESVEMIQAAIDAGITDMILTPHYGPRRGFMASNELINKNYQILQDEVNKLKLTINLYLGREIDAVDNIIELLDSGQVQTLNNTKYVLIDFGMEKIDIDEYCYELIIAGYKPIIAHVERYAFITDFELYKKFKKTGALLQVNTASLYKPRTKHEKKAIRYLQKNKLIDLTGSDAHNNKKVYSLFNQSDSTTQFIRKICCINRRDRNV